MLTLNNDISAETWGICVEIDFLLKLCIEINNDNFSQVLLAENLYHIIPYSKGLTLCTHHLRTKRTRADCVVKSSEISGYKEK